MPAEIMSSSPKGKQKKTKLEKICELESSLKLANEENKRLRKELECLRGGGSGTHLRSSRSSCSAGSAAIPAHMGDFEKMKDALKAMKRVTVSQEMSISDLRTKASQRRKELKARDHRIAALQREVKSLKKAQKSMESAGSEGQMRAKINELERACYDEESRNIELAEKLQEREGQIVCMQKRLERLPGLKRSGSDHSMKSMESASTQSEFDVARLKKDLAKKANKVVQLEMELEHVKDELHEARQQHISFDNDTFDAFGQHHESSFYADEEDDEDFADEQETFAHNFWE